VDQETRAVRALAVVFAVIGLCGCVNSREQNVRRRLATQTTGTIELPSGAIEVSSELTLAPGAHDLEIVGSATLLRATREFHGRGIIVGESASHITLRGISFAGNAHLAVKTLEMAPPENAFRIAYSENGVWFDRINGLTLEQLQFSAVNGFAILISRSTGIRIEQDLVEDSGSQNAKMRNNSTGGIVIEEGSSDFEVRDCTVRRVRGNGIWTHSLFTSPRLHDGVIAKNHFDTIGRDAIQVGHATNVRVEDNDGAHIGFPIDTVDVENGGVPVTLDTAGNVDHSIYQRNKFEDVNGKCIDLDGFHGGSVRNNSCISRRRPEDYPSGHFAIVMNNTDPNMHSENIEIVDNVIDGTKYGGLFLIGRNHTVTGNTFLHIDSSKCNDSAAKFPCIYKKDEPNMLESGIYLGRGIARMEETRGNVIRGNTISGHKMKSHCIVAGPGVSLGANSISGNTCEDYSTLNH
jgi:hypothetical protein